MSFGFLDLYTQKVSLGGADADTIAAAQVAKPLDVAGFEQMTSLGYRSARSEMIDFVSSRTYEMYEDAIDLAQKRTGKTLPNPHVVPTLPPAERKRRLASFLRGEDTPVFAEGIEQRRARFEQEYAALRQEHPDLPDPATFREKAIAEIKQRRAELRAAQVGSTGLGDIGEFVGQTGAEFQHPLNIATLPLGAPAALYAPVKTGIMAGVMRVLGVGAIESSIAATTQLAIETEKVPRLQGYGVKYDWDDAWGNVLGAAGAGFVLGSGFRALVAGWRAARGSGPGSAQPYSPEIGGADDAARVAERLLLDQESPLPPRASDAHAEALTEARIAVAEGRAPDTAAIMQRGLADVRAEGEEMLARARREGAPAAREAPDSSPQPSAVFTPAGRRVEVGYEVVDIRTLIPSHTDDFHPNAAFPAALQPRDRARAANRVQVAEIASGLAPERLGPSPDATTGAPIVAVDNVVESGNGRVLALRKTLAEGGDTAKAYRTWLEKQGYDTSGIENPVLVARRRTPLDPTEREAFVREANAAAAARMAVSEQAASDARLVTPLVELYRGGEVTFAQNADFVRGFLKGIPASERGALWTEKGGLSQEGGRRVQAAILHAAYGDPSLVAKLLEAPSNDIKAIGGALMDVAPEWAKMRERARKGEINPDVDRTADLMGAVRVIEDARQKGVLVSDLLDQGGLFESPEPTRLFVGMMFNDPALRQAAGRAAVGQRLHGYIDEANKTQAGPNLFGEAPATASEILVATDKQRVLANLVDEAKAAREAGERQKPEPVKPPKPVEPEVIVKEIERGFPAFHGSPFKFERFDIEKIGTGEGAAAFGHGIYFAENIKTAAMYQQTVSSMKGLDRVEAKTLAEGYARNKLGMGGTVEDAIKSVEFDIATTPRKRGKGPSQMFVDALEMLRSGEIKPPGHLYEVMIRARAEDFLNWDAPLSKQPETVQSLWREHMESQPRGENAKPGAEVYVDPDTTGKQIYQELGKGRDKAAASERLREAGVPGIKYLDKGSRDVGDGTRNYVVFDDSIIEIAKIDGIVQRVKTPDEAAALAKQIVAAQDKALAEVTDPKAEAILGEINKGRAQRGEPAPGTGTDKQGQADSGARAAEQASARAGRTADDGADAPGGEVPGVGGEGPALKPEEAKLETARRTVAEADVPVPRLDGEEAASGRALLDEAQADVDAASIIRNCAIGSAI